MEQSTTVYNRLNEYQLFQEWTGTYTSYTDGLLCGLAVCLALCFTDPSSEQVQPHLVVTWYVTAKLLGHVSTVISQHFLSVVK